MDAFPHILSFENRSYECRRAIFGCYTTDEQVPYLPIRVQLRSHMMGDVSNGLGIDASDLSSVTGYDCNWRDVSLDCSNAQVAAHLNGVIWEHLGLVGLPQQQEPGGLMPPSAYCGESFFRWYTARGALRFADGKRGTLWGPTGNHLCSRVEERELNLPCLPKLTAQSDAVSDPLFFGRVRVMVIEAMDEAKMFEKVSAPG